MSRIMQMPPPPPLLLTKRVTSFLRANLSPHMHSAMLTTPAGSLLAHASTLPASALRRQAAVAASLWALQGPPASHGPATAPVPPGSTVRTRRTAKHAPPTATVQLDSGAVFVIRRLRCGMLFICMGGADAAGSGPLTPTPTPPAPHMTRLSRSPAPTAPTTEAQSQDQPPDITTTTTTTTDPSITPRPSTPPPSSSTTAPPLTPTPPNNPSTTTTTTGNTALPGNPSSSSSTTTTTTTPSHPSSPSQASILSTHTTGAASTASTATVSGSSSASLMRRQVEELARWLDERLGGLCVPEEGIGIFGGSGGMGAAGNGNGGLEVR